MERDLLGSARALPVPASAVEGDRYLFEIPICSDLDQNGACGTNEPLLGHGRDECFYGGIDVLPLEATLRVSPSFDPALCDAP